MLICQMTTGIKSELLKQLPHNPSDPGYLPTVSLDLFPLSAAHRWVLRALRILLNPEDIINCVILLSIMNFLGFLNSASSLLNFNFSPPGSFPQNSFIESLALPTNPGSLKQNPIHHQQSLLSQFSQQTLDSAPIQQLLIKQQQELLNQCIKMNIELVQKSNQEPEAEETHSAPKGLKKVTKCDHTSRKHYAKGLCSNCYHKIGRNKKPWNCKHTVLYAAGMCHNCYINRYNKIKRDQHKLQEQCPEIQADEAQPNNQETQK